jgi:muconate cycloisomerase
LEDISQVWNFADTLPRGKEHNAAICALEMALLDALGKMQGRSVIQYFSHQFLASKVHYGATIPLSDKQKTIDLCRFAENLGITNLRIKMGKDFERNRDALEAVSSVFGDKCDIRIDPNRSWDRDFAFKHINIITKYGVNVVEEPMQKNNPSLGEFAKALHSEGMSLMACESAPTLSHVNKILDRGYYDIINIKLSRCGGFRRSLGIIDRVRGSDLSFQIGCQIGESGILSAAGRVLCLLCRDARYYDGSYDSFLLSKNLTSKDVTFGHRGEAGPLDRPGLGVEVSRRNLENLCNEGAPFLTVTRP